MYKIHTCSTFLLSQPDELLVGHNLDDYIPVPGLVFINKRGVSKQSISWDDLRFGRSKSRPSLAWVSRFGSLTCNAFGKEFPDGGMNEAGLYVGEMTLLGTVYPPAQQLPKIYHHQWIQYLLDNFETVEQALATFEQVAIEGHCQWHFFIADAGGHTAIIEFIQGKKLIYSGASMPVKVLCNAPYAQELSGLAEYTGFGGPKLVDFEDRSGPARFAQAAALLRQAEAESPATSALDIAFTILQQLDCGNNRWKLVFDLHNRQLHYRTWLVDDIRSVAFASMDLSARQPALMLDIHQPGSGDVSADLKPFDERLNHRSIHQMWQGIDLGRFLNLFFKPVMIRRLSSYPRAFHPI